MQDIKKSEIESLNLEELDIDELEHRLELAAAGTPGFVECPDNCDTLYPTGCDCDGLYPTGCSCYCTGYGCYDAFGSC